MKTFNLPRIIAFCVRKYGVATHAEGIHATCIFYWNQNLRFWRVVLVSSQNVLKTAKNQNLTFLKAITFGVRQFASSGASHCPLAPLNPQYQIWEASFWEMLNRFTKYSQTKNVTIPRTITLCKNILAAAAYAGSFSKPFYLLKPYTQVSED